MENKFLDKGNIFINYSNFTDLLIMSNGYMNLDENIIKEGIEFDPQKTYEVAQSNFIDFNQHLYEGENDMNSISCGLFIERALITFRLFIWGAKGEGFEIFKHVLRGEEILNIDSKDEIDTYIKLHLKEFEEGILKTYNKEIKESYEDFGRSIESRQLPLQNLLQFISIDNNMADFK